MPTKRPDFPEIASERQFEEHRVATVELLAEFQFLEEFLKWYLVTVNDLADRHFGKTVPFPKAYELFEKWPLVPLIREFDRHTYNKALVKQLNDLVPMRNHVVHRVFFVQFGADGQHEDLSEAVHMLKVGKALTTKILLEVRDEIDKLRELLGFSKLSEGHFQTHVDDESVPEPSQRDTNETG